MKLPVEDKSKTGVYLKKLIELEIVEREFSVDDGTKERAKTNCGLYRLTDNFFRFWYAFVFTNYSDLEIVFDDKLNAVAADNDMIRLIGIDKIVEYQAQYSQSESSNK